MLVFNGNLEHRFSNQLLIATVIFLELKRFTAKEIDIKKIIIEEFKICGFPKAEQIATKALDKGKLLILLDGLDEIPTKNLNSVIDTIQDFVDNYDKNR
ncbi:MAG: hypothetical protein QNJ55_11520 [Xenococcus sp. MO_188.B8]|nr:hypothetical protein [Xenococcus sp. MO_188.B8]